MVLRSVKNWLTLLILGLVALAMIVAWAYVVPPLADRLDKQKLVEQRGNATLISDTFSQWLILNPSDRASLLYTIRRLGQRLTARVVVINRNLGVGYDTQGPDSIVVNDYPMIKQAATSARVVQGVVVTPTGRYAATAVPIPQVGTVEYVVLVIAPLKDVDNAVDAVQEQLLRATLLALLVSLALGYLASFFIARRLKRIELSAESIAAGDLTAKVPDTVRDEIGQLATTFNVMADRLRGAFAEVEYERDRVEVLLNDLSEGVIGLSAEGVVTIANPAAAVLMGEPAPVGAALDAAFPADVADAWHESRKAGTVEAVVFLLGERTLEATTYPVGSAADFTSIVVLRDVTAEARLARARRDLIANASHEFKTPLFSLAGSLELLDEGDLSADEQSEFLQIMRQQVDRLRGLAVSMLDLSRVEAGAIDIQPEVVDLRTVAQSVLDEFQAAAQTKEVNLIVEDGDDHTAWCDEQRLAQILRALVDNAIKFSPPGSTVRVATGGDERRALVTVSDDGPGIEPAELPHVFERFHRGRDERATTTGAGLGLSIARELTELMGGSITAESSGGSGARFAVNLPRRP
jgi:two-component system sensor histidine kinase VicK